VIDALLWGQPFGIDPVQARPVEAEPRDFLLDRNRAEVLEQAVVLNAVKVTLEVRESNRVAQNLYRKYGFAVASTRPRYYQDNGENAFLMALEGVRGEAYRRALRDLTGLLQARLASADGEPIRARSDR